MSDMNLLLQIDSPKSTFLLAFATSALLAGACSPYLLVAKELDEPSSVPEAISVEASRPNDGMVGRPLPLASHWNTGLGTDGFDPQYQMQMIERGHYLLPWFHFPAADQQSWNHYYEAPIKKAAELRLPIALVGTQWEHLLTDDKAYFDLPPAKNPNVIGSHGKVRREVDPLAPIDPWREVGKVWTSSPMMEKLQAWYPNPPLVLLVSNNEHAKLSWPKAEESKRYLDLYGKGRDDNFKRKIFAHEWITRYRALQQGMREGLTNSNWKRNVIFVGYDAFGPPHLARMRHWKTHSLYVPRRIDPSPLSWDGGSPSYYVHNWNASTDYTVWSPQIEAMNWVFMLREAYTLNPHFWFEISTWDGHQPSQPNDKRRTYATRGQTFSPARYGGMVQFGMWLLRPRVVREFRGWLETRTEQGPYFLPIVQAVDRVHTNPTLRAFWRNGALVANPAHRHPYQMNMPKEYADVDRWFLLDTNLDPWRPWGLHTQLPVFSLALVVGEKPTREWLIYAYAPLGPKPNVKVTIPDFAPVTIDVPQSGGFYRVEEKTRKVIPVSGV